MNISQLPKIIININNYLKYLTLEIKFHYYDHISDNEDFLKISSMILRELSKLPLSLYYLDLILLLTQMTYKYTFENYKHIELKKLLIRIWSQNINIDITL